MGHITPAVDIYNTVSLTYALPVGGEDLHAIEGDLRLKVTDGGDAFLPLGEEADDPTRCPASSPTSMMRALCAAAGTGATAFARRCPMIRPMRSWRLSAWSPEPDGGNAQAAIDRLADLLERYLGATVVIKTLVTRDNPCVEL